MRVNTHALLSDCVERGVACGLSRCEEYEIEPDSMAGHQRISDEVMNAIAAFFNWDDEVHDG